MALTNGVQQNGFHQNGSSTYKIADTPLGSRRPLRVVCIGAGFSGLLMATVFEQKMQNQNIEFQIYESNNDLGGTWLVNRYPGCQCDIPAHNYAYSFEANPNWPNYYASSEEIFDYLKGVAKKYDCGKYIKYQSTVNSANWNDASGKWEIMVHDLEKDIEFTDSPDILVNAGGLLNNWKWPEIAGIETFQGKLMHSAQWDQEYDFNNKKVAVIGIGSSAIQILPQLATKAKNVTAFVRSKTWISPEGIVEPEKGDPKMDKNQNYDPEELKRFKEDPKYLQEHRRVLADRRIRNFKSSMAGSEAQSNADAFYRKTMIERLGNTEKGKEIAEWLLPDFPVGCRRVTPGPGFLESLVQDNVNMLWDNIDRVTATGIRTKDGRHIEFDAICCATGFDTTFRPRFPVVGLNGIELSKKWEQNEPECYFGTTVPDFPNYFAFIGPNSPISNGSLVQAIQMTGVYISQCIEKIQTQGIKSFTANAKATSEYNDHTQEYLKGTVWTAPCSSWYKRGTKDGRVVAIYAGSTYHFIESLRKPRWEDYDIEYWSSNRFAFLGNGFTQREAREETVADTQTLNFDEYWNLMVLPDIYG